MSGGFLDSPRNVTGAIILALGIAIAIALSPFAVGLLGALVLAVLVGPLHRRLTTLLGSSRASTLVVILVTLLVLVPGGIVLGLVIGEGPAAMRAVQDNALIAWLREKRVAGVDVGAQLAKASGTILEWISAQALGVAGSAARGAVNLLIALFALYFLLQSGGGLWQRSKRYLPFSDANADALAAQFVSVTQATFVGLAAAATLQGTLVGIGFLIVGLPGAAFWGLITAVASVIPVFGAALVWVPGCLVLIVEKQYGNAALLAGIGALVVSNIDNVVRPYIYRRVSDIHPLVTLVGAFAGLRYFGLLGVLLGPLAITYFFQLLHIYDEEYGVTVSAREFARARNTGQRPVVTDTAGTTGSGTAR